MGKRSFISSITGITSLLINLIRLIKEISNIKIPIDSYINLSPTSWIFIHFFLMLYGNIALAYVILDFIDKKSFNNHNSNINSQRKIAYILLVNFIFVPSLVIWTSLIGIYISFKSGFGAIILLNSLFLYPLCCFLILYSGITISNVFNKDIKNAIDF